ncbi:YqhA family protein, partial [uncultured Pseudoalteromonas sp.]
MSEHVTHSKVKKVPTKLEQIVESFIFRSRWLLAPFFIGLLVAVVLLLLKFFKYLYSMALNT